MRKTQQQTARFQPEPVMKASHHSELINHIKKELPVACGIYLFFNAEGRVIYVGKSVRIRNRVLNHFQQTNDGNYSWKGGVSDNACYVKYIITNDELLALLIEDKLIKTYKPIFNVKQKQ